MRTPVAIEFEEPKDPEGLDSLGPGTLYVACDDGTVWTRPAAEQTPGSAVTWTQIGEAIPGSAADEE